MRSFRGWISSGSPTESLRTKQLLKSSESDFSFRGKHYSVKKCMFKFFFIKLNLSTVKGLVNICSMHVVTPRYPILKYYINNQSSIDKTGMSLYFSKFLNRNEYYVINTNKVQRNIFHIINIIVQQESWHKGLNIIIHLKLFQITMKGSKQQVQKKLIHKEWK